MVKISFYFIRIIFILTLITQLISCDRKISVSDPQVFEVGIADYYIETNPPGAAIFIDDHYIGKHTPDTINWVEKGPHSFKVKLPPFLDHTFEEEILTDSLYSKNYDFYSNPLNKGSIKFISNPKGSSIYLDDKLMSFKTPYVLNDVTLGNHKIKFTFPEHRADSISIFVYPQEQVYAEMYLVDTTIWVNYNTENSDISTNNITDICIDDNNTIWIGTAHDGIIKIKNGNKEFIRTGNSSLPDNIINKIKKDDNNNIWVGTSTGLVKIVDETLITYTTINSEIPNNYIQDFDFDDRGYIWIGTGNGLARFDGAEWKVYRTTNSYIPSDYITSVLVESRYSIWLGSKEFNIIHFDAISKWKSFQADVKLVGDYVSDLVFGPDNNLWVGLITEFADPVDPTRSGGIYFLEDGKLTRINFNLSEKSIHRFFKDGEKLWIGTQSGILSVNSKQNYKLFSTATSGIPINDITAISKDNKGNMWFGTNGKGLVKYKIGE